MPVGFLRPQSVKDEDAWLDYFVKELRALQEAVGGASPLGDDAALRELAAFYLTYARDLIDERKYAGRQNQPLLRRAGGARASRDAPGIRGGARAERLVAFARVSNLILLIHQLRLCGAKGMRAGSGGGAWKYQTSMGPNQCLPRMLASSEICRVPMRDEPTRVVAAFEFDAAHRHLRRARRPV